MDRVSMRYDNFKEFCHQILPDNEFVQMLQTTPLPLFIHTIKHHHQDNKSVDEICNIIFDKANIDTTKLKEMDLKKFNRYVNYFSDVLKSLA